VDVSAAPVHEEELAARHTPARDEPERLVDDFIELLVGSGWSHPAGASQRVIPG
jgi:hypothetical protein